MTLDMETAMRTALDADLLTRPKTFIWTDASIETLVTLAKQGKSTREIGAVLGVSRNAVIGKLFRLRDRPPRSIKVPRIEWTPPVVAIFREEWAKGTQVKDIARMLGVSRYVLHHARWRLGLPARVRGTYKRPSTPKRLAKALALRVTPIARPLPPTAYPMPKRLHDAPQGQKKTIWQLDAHDCRFATGEREGQHVFCGKPAKDGKPYCDAHCAVAYTGTVKGANK